jgi:hypothetical protein
MQSAGMATVRSSCNTSATRRNLSPEVVAVIGHHHDLSAEQKPVAVLVPVLTVKAPA